MASSPDRRDAVAIAHARQVSASISRISSDQALAELRRAYLDRQRQFQAFSPLSPLESKLRETGGERHLNTPPPSPPCKAPDRELFREQASKDAHHSPPSFPERRIYTASLWSASGRSRRGKCVSDFHVEPAEETPDLLDIEAFRKAIPRPNGAAAQGFACKIRRWWTLRLYWRRWLAFMRTCEIRRVVGLAAFRHYEFALLSRGFGAFVHGTKCGRAAKFRRGRLLAAHIVRWRRGCAAAFETRRAALAMHRGREIPRAFAAWVEGQQQLRRERALERLASELAAARRERSRRVTLDRWRAETELAAAHRRSVAFARRYAVSVALRKLEQNASKTRRLRRLLSAATTHYAHCATRRTLRALAALAADRQSERLALGRARAHWRRARLKRALFTLEEARARSMVRLRMATDFHMLVMLGSTLSAWQVWAHSEVAARGREATAERFARMSLLRRVLRHWRRRASTAYLETARAFDAAHRTEFEAWSAIRVSAATRWRRSLHSKD